MSIELMKEYILKAYDYGEAWVEKVEKMSDGQIYAIYNRLLNEGRLS